MASISEDQTIESGLIADIAGYVPASAVLTRGQRQEARYKLRASLRRVTSLKRLQFLRTAAWGCDDGAAER